MNTIPTVTKNLLIINVLMFLGTIVAQSYGIDLNNYLGLHFFLAGDFNAAQLITYMFMHGGTYPFMFSNNIYVDGLESNSKYVFQYVKNVEILAAKLLQKSEMRKDIVIELSYKGFG